MAYYKAGLSILLSLCLFFESVAGECWTPHREWLGRCVQVVDSYMDIVGSQSSCQSSGGKLLELNDLASELPRLQNLMVGSGSSGIWLGGKANKVWYWADDYGNKDKIISEKYWGVGEPNQNEKSLEDKISLLNSLQTPFTWNDEKETTSQYGGDINSYYKAICSVDKNSVVYGNDFDWLFTMGQKKYFIPKQSGLNWKDAIELCATKYQANLIRIESQALQNELQARLSLSNNYWTAGLWDRKYSLTWSTSGKPIPYDFRTWSRDPTQDPALDNQCVYTHQTAYGPRFSYASCTENKKYICAYSHKNGDWEITTAPSTTTSTTTTTAPITAATTTTLLNTSTTGTTATSTATSTTTSTATLTAAVPTPTATAKTTNITVTVTAMPTKPLAVTTMPLTTATFVETAPTTMISATTTTAIAIPTKPTITSLIATKVMSTTKTVSSTTKAIVTAEAAASGPLVAKPSKTYMPVQTTRNFTATATTKSQFKVPARKTSSVKSPYQSIHSSSALLSTYHGYNDFTTPKNFIFTPLGQTVVIIAGGLLCLLFLLMFLMLLYRKLHKEKKTKVNPDSDEFGLEERGESITPKTIYVQPPEGVKKDSSYDFWP